MSSPLGHALAGAILVWPQHGKMSFPKIPVLLTGMVIANIPDLDFIPGFILGQPNLFHHGISHSLGAALLFALFWELLLNRLVRWRVYISSMRVFFLYSSHLFLDLLSRDGRPPFGIPLFWPFIDTYFIVPILPAVRHSQYDHASVGMVLRDIFSLHNVYVMGMEILLLLPLLLAMFLWTRWHNGQVKAL